MHSKVITACSFQRLGWKRAFGPCCLKKTSIPWIQSAKSREHWHAWALAISSSYHTAATHHLPHLPYALLAFPSTECILRSLLYWSSNFTVGWRAKLHFYGLPSREAILSFLLSNSKQIATQQQFPFHVPRPMQRQFFASQEHELSWIKHSLLLVGGHFILALFTMGSWLWDELWVETTLIQDSNRQLRGLWREWGGGSLKVKGTYKTCVSRGPTQQPVYNFYWRVFSFLLSHGHLKASSYVSVLIPVV